LGGWLVEPSSYGFFPPNIFPCTAGRQGIQKNVSGPFLVAQEIFQDLIKFTEWRI
jgi:hypothetical protein